MQTARSPELGISIRFRHAHPETKVGISLAARKLTSFEEYSIESHEAVKLLLFEATDAALYTRLCSSLISRILRKALASCKRDEARVLTRPSHSATRLNSGTKTMQWTG